MSENSKIDRRTTLKLLGATAGATVAPRVAKAQPKDAGPGELATIAVDPAPRYTLSPHLYMQFMEPLGATDGSVEASWDHREEKWREDLVEATRTLAPPMMRWGGIFCDYYHWYEAVGPRSERKPLINLLWGGIESNQIGTVEFVDFCRQIDSEPLICVNFESDGRPHFMEYKGESRTGDAQEAADWVAYCNDPENPLRKEHGLENPLNVRFWNLGNETSYARRGFKQDKAIQKTIEFAKAMRRVDPSLELIGWGDDGWAGPMIEEAGEHLQYVDFHHMFNPDDSQDPVLAGEAYRRDPGATWQVLMEAWKQHDRKIRGVRDSLNGHEFPLAMTECHFSIPGRDRCDVMSTWATGVSYGRILNTNQRHGDLLKIATAADFAGNRWQVNAVMLTTPGNKSFLMPVARVMQLYRHHQGERAVQVIQTPDGLDVVASRTGDTIYLHVVNTQRDRPLRANFSVLDRSIRSSKIFQIAEDPMVEVHELNADTVMQVEQREATPAEEWQFPAASVSAVELQLS